jgi:hypothetical protein
VVNRRSFLAGGVAAVCQHARAATVRSIELYVSPAGRDENSGQRDKPFATIARARDEVRKLIRDGLQQNVIVWIRGGTYKLEDTLGAAFDYLPGHSGREPGHQFGRGD